jgi:putative ABC transport system substrate-binding protein
MKKTLTIFLVSLLALSLAIVMNPISAKSEDMILIGVSQIVEHPSLDSVRQGFIDYLNENGYEEGARVTYDINIAQGDMGTAILIAEKLVGMNPDLILSITTPTSQSIVNATEEIPVLFAAVTDPVGAGLVDDLAGGGKNVTGTSDLSPVRSQLELVLEVIPDLKKLGIIYNAGEANSVTYLNWAKEEAKDLGIELVEATVSNSNEVLMAAESLVGKVDAIHIPTDNTVASAFEAVTKVCVDSGIPLFASSILAVERGAVAAIAIDPYRLGRQTGRMAIEILEGKNPGDMPVEVLEDFLLYVNLDYATKIGVEIPKKIIKRADVVIDEK